jgi:hypothetical protein
MATERSVTTTAGASYLDISGLLCSRRGCPAIVGNILVYRDDNHITTFYANWLTPALSAELTALMPHLFAGR